MADLRKLRGTNKAAPSVEKKETEAVLERPQRPAEIRASEVIAEGPATALQGQPVPAAPEPKEKPLYDSLMILPLGAFFEVAKEKLRSLGIKSMQEFIVMSQNDPELALLVKAANARNSLGSILTFLPSPAPSEEPRMSGIPMEGKVDHPSVYEATVASDVGQMPPPPSPAPATRPAKIPKPPPPPPRTKSEPPKTRPDGAAARKEDPITEFLRELDSSSAPPVSKLEQAKSFFDNIRLQFVSSIPGFSSKQDSWKRKREQALADHVRPAFDAEEIKIERFMVAIQPLKSYIDNLQKCVDVGNEMRERQNGNGKPSDPPKAPSIHPSASARRPTPLALKPIEAPAPAAPQAKPGVMKRIFTSYTTLAVFGAAAFGGAAAFNGRFADLGEGARQLIERVAGADVGRIPSWAAAAAYGAVMACALTVSLFLQSSRKRKLAEITERQSRLSAEDHSRTELLVDELRRIRESSAGGNKGILLSIVNRLQNDEGLLLEMYRFKGREVFPDIMERAGIPPSLLAPIRNETLINLERVKMRESLRPLAEHAGRPADLRNAFQRLYQGDELFRLMCDELFFQNIAQEYVNGTRAEDIFKSVKGSSGEGAGSALLEAMRKEYPRISQKR